MSYKIHWLVFFYDLIIAEEMEFVLLFDSFDFMIIHKLIENILIL